MRSEIIPVPGGIDGYRFVRLDENGQIIEVSRAEALLYFGKHELEYVQTATY